MPNRKVTQTLDFVRGLMKSADEIDRALSGELEPRKVLAKKHTNIAKLDPGQIQELGMYQGRVVLVPLAAELALKYLWETENAGGAPVGHDLLKCFNRLSDHHTERCLAAGEVEGVSGHVHASYTRNLMIQG